MRIHDYGPILESFAPGEFDRKRDPSRLLPRLRPSPSELGAQVSDNVTGKGETLMTSKVYVGGLPYAATETQLTTLFATHGTVESARVISDKLTGRSRGFAFVEMSTPEEAQAAITALNGMQMDGRFLTVSQAKPLQARPGGGGRSSAFRRESDSDHRSRF
jgi:RNA recognition motif-containing protein